MRPLFFSHKIDGNQISLDSAENHHAERVQRTQIGDDIRVADGCGNWSGGKVISLSPVTIEVFDRGVEKPSGISVLQAVTKTDGLNEVIDLLTQIGVDEIIPWISERSIPKWDPSKKEKHLQKWQETARTSAKQTRRARIPIVKPVVESMIDLSDFDQVVVLHESSDRVDFPKVAEGKVLIVVGPEGGLSDQEVSNFEKHGALISTIGPNIFKSIHAGVIASTIFQYQRKWFEGRPN